MNHEFTTDSPYDMGWPDLPEDDDGWENVKLTHQYNEYQRDVDDVLWGAMLEESAFLGRIHVNIPKKTLRSRFYFMMARRVWQPLHDLALRHGAWCPWED